MKIDYRGQDNLTFSGSVLPSTVSLQPGVNEVDPELLRSLLNNDYFNSLVETEIIILKEVLPVLSIREDTPVIEAAKKQSLPPGRIPVASFAPKKALEFSDES